MWPIERMRRHAGPEEIPRDIPLALVAHTAHGLVIAAANEAAGAAGIRHGETLADTRAAHPAMATRPADAGGDHADLVRLAHWCGRYGPNRNLDGSDGLWIDITGVAHLFRSRSAMPAEPTADADERALLDDLVGRLARLGLSARVGLADTLGAAHAVARHATSPAAPIAIVPPGGIEAALAHLPVAALRLVPTAVHLLERLGLRRIGQLYGMPRATIERRFRHPPAGDKSKSRDKVPPGAHAGTNAGHAAAVVLRLDQARGHSAEPRRPLEEKPTFAARLVFHEPLLTAAGVEAALSRLCADLVDDLARKAVGGRRFRLVLYRVDGTLAQTSIGTRLPCQDAGHIRRLFTEKIADLDAGFGIDVAVLAADETERYAATQGVLDRGGAQCAGDAGETSDRLVDRLSTRLGVDRILRLEPCSSHIPERAQRMVHALTAEPGTGDAKISLAPLSAAGLPARPAFLLARPEPITVLAAIPEGAPALIKWRRARRRIVRAEGPERIAAEWWRQPGSFGESHAAATTRDYYVVEEETGARYWVFRAGLYGVDAEETDAIETGPRWFMHGIFG